MLEIDDDDSHAMEHGPSFALLIHGTQPAGTKAARADLRPCENVVNSDTASEPTRFGGGCPWR